MLKRLAGDTLVYGLGQVSQQLIALITLPLFARMLTPADYGMLETLGTLSAVALMVASLQFESGMQRRYFDYRADEPDRRRQVIVTAMATVCLWDLVLLALAWPFAEPVMRYFQGGPGSGVLLMYSLIGAFAGVGLTLCREVLRLQRRPWTYSAISLGNSLVWTAIGLYVVYTLRWGLYGYVWGGALAVLATLPLALWFVRGELKGRYSPPDLREMLHFALPLIPTAGALWLMGLADRLVLNHWVDLTQIGYYGIGQKMTRLVSIVLMAFATAWTPYIFGLYSEDPEREKEVRALVTPFYFVALAGAAVLLTGFAPELISLLASPVYLPATAVVPPLCLGVVGSGLTQMLCSGISLAKQTKYFAVYTAVCGVLNVGLNLALVPRWGTTGSSWATAISFAVLNVLYYRKSQALYPTPYPVKSLLLIAVVTVAMVCGLGEVQGLGWRLLGIVAFLPLLYAVGAIDRQIARQYLGRVWQAVRVRGGAEIGS